MPVIIRFALMIAGFLLMAVSARRRARRTIDRMATIERAPFAAPVATDVGGALAELLGVADDHTRWTITSDSTPAGPDLAEATWTRTPGLPTTIWVLAELHRPVALPITFGAWKPHGLAAFERRARGRLGIDEGVIVDDQRLGRDWMAWVADESSAMRALDADPAVWASVQALTPPTMRGSPLATPRPDRLVKFTTSSLRLGSGVKVSFRGRYVLVGPGSEPSLGGPGREDLARAAEQLAATFRRADAP